MIHQVVERARFISDGEAVKSCTILAAQADGCSITTIEGLSKDGVMHPMQQAFMENHGLAMRLLHTWNGDGSNWLAE